jgi:hypothetical protein
VLVQRLVEFAVHRRHERLVVRWRQVPSDIRRVLPCCIKLPALQRQVVLDEILGLMLQFLLLLLVDLVQDLALLHHGRHILRQGSLDVVRPLIVNGGSTSTSRRSR